MKQGKVWGMTSEVYSDGETISVHQLSIVRGGYCSIHVHEYKSNVFLVLNGRLEIAQWPRGREVPDTTILTAGETTEVKPGVWHNFRALEDVNCIEIYHGRLIGDDINRRTAGGIA